MFLVAVLESIANGAPLSEADLKNLLAGIRQNRSVFFPNTRLPQYQPRREMNTRLSFDTACELSFLGSLDERER